MHTKDVEAQIKDTCKSDLVQSKQNRLCVCVYVCVCVRERERERENGIMRDCRRFLNVQDQKISKTQVMGCDHQLPNTLER